MRSKEKSTKIIFVRHAQPDFPIDRIYCDFDEDPQLTQEGLKQARVAAEFFKDVSIEALYASPAARTLATAEPISGITGHAITTVEGLRERRFGHWEGLYFHEIEEKYPNDYLDWKKDKVNYTPEGGETMVHVVERLEAALGEIIARHRGQTVAVVSHVGPIRVCVTRAFEMPLHQYRQIRIDYASISRIDYGETQNNLIFLNHLRYI